MKTTGLIAGVIACILCATQVAVSQETKGFDFSADWTYADLAKIPNADPVELSWLEKNTSPGYTHQVLKLISHLSKPSTCQLLPAYAIYDGSYQNKLTHGLLDSLLTRCPDGDAGIVHNAFLIAKIRKKYVYDDAGFGSKPFEVPQHATLQANNLKLSFDFGPANTILSILAYGPLPYDTVYKRIDTHAFDAMIHHRNQSFYEFPFTREKLAYCLLKAAGNQPLDSLYRLMNPNGLLHFGGVRGHLADYQKVLNTLTANEHQMLDLIKIRLLPYTPNQVIIDRKVTFFFGQGADGWASGDVTGMDLEYYKDDYPTMMRLLQHETFHTVQHVVATFSQSSNKEFMPYQHMLNSVFLEGTATFIADPSPKTEEQSQQAVKLGVSLFEQATKAFQDKNIEEMDRLKTKGIQAAGPFYTMGKKMTEDIDAAFGPERIKKILPLGGVVFFKTYFDAIEKHGSKSLFGDSVKKLISTLPNDYDGEN